MIGKAIKDLIEREQSEAEHDPYGVNMVSTVQNGTFSNPA